MYGIIFKNRSFDELQIGTGFVSRQFQYLSGEATDTHVDNGKLKSSPTTQLVSQITFSDETTLSYSYDAEERITSVVKITKVNGQVFTTTTLYTYDALGQLETETVDGVTTKYVYDNYGNIRAKGVTDESGEIVEATKITYAYDTTWKDLLTSYNGQSITYDAQGNPTSYLGHTLTWEKGRQLKSFDNNTYTYNANGIRTSKIVNGIKHDYILDGTKILRETWGGNTLIPLYDNEDSVCGMLYNNVPYYFQKNLQGDIISIATVVDGEDGYKEVAIVARYTYDAWGKVLSIRNGNNNADVSSDVTHIANINPFRYRGYYYDAEIGMYYLQSRYYNPTVGRFVNGDDANYLGNDGTVLTYNLLIYCENSPVMLTDDTGFSTWSYLSSIIGKLSNGINKFNKFLLEFFGLSKKAYAHKKKYNNTTKIMRFVNDNKKSIRKLGRYASKLSSLIDFISVFIDCKSIIKKSKNTFTTFANLICYALIKLIGIVLNKFVSFIISKIFPVLCWAKFILEWILNEIVDLFMGSSFVTNICSKFVKYLDKNKITIANCFISLFKSASACFA